MLVRTGVIVTFLIICAWITYIDIRKHKIYNGAVAALLVPAIVSFFVFPEISPASRGLGSISISGILFLICLIRPGAFGGGDVKLMVPMGLFLGLERTLYAGILAVFTSGIWAMVTVLYEVHKCGKPVHYSGSLWRTKICKKRVPLGPALCIGAVLALLL